MKKYRIISDGACDLSAEIVKELDIDIVPFYISFDKETYLKEGVDITLDESYQRMVDNPQLFPKTSLPSIEDYCKVFKKNLEAGLDILCICITTKFSGSYNSAQSAKELCLEEYPDAKIYVVDSMVNTCLQGLLVKETCRMRDNGFTLEEAYQKVEALKKTGRIYFMVGSMEYLRRGGRIGKLIGLVGSKLHIKPVIVLKEGEIFPCGISLTRKKAILKVLDQVEKFFKDNNPEDYIFTTGCGANVDEHDDFNNSIKGVVKTDKVTKSYVGVAMAVHTGPYPLGVGLIKRYDA